MTTSTLTAGAMQAKRARGETIADIMNAEGMTARGARWYHTTVQRVLATPAEWVPEEAS